MSSEEQTGNLARHDLRELGHPRANFRDEIEVLRIDQQRETQMFHQMTSAC